MVPLELSVLQLFKLIYEKMLLAMILSESGPPLLGRQTYENLIPREINRGTFPTH